MSRVEEKIKVGVEVKVGSGDYKISKPGSVGVIKEIHRNKVVVFFPKLKQKFAIKKEDLLFKPEKKEETKEANKEEKVAEEKVKTKKKPGPKPKSKSKSK